ncbi:MAG: AAA family ATPase, partial [Marinoscillum sp.]
MYINSITLKNIRTFAAESTIHFNYPERVYGEDKPIKQAPKLKNVNLLFGENSTGKSTVLEVIALASLGPAIIESRIDPKPLVRLIPSQRKPSEAEKSEIGTIRAFFTLHEGEFDSIVPPSSRGFSSELLISKKGKLENIEHKQNKNIRWKQVYEDENAAFFIVAYGTSRRGSLDSERSKNLRNRTHYWRTDRINSIIKDEFTLVDFWEWFVNHKRRKKRSELIVKLINRALAKSQLKYEGNWNEDDCLFTRGGMEIPLRSLSDGYKGFLSWITDLLYHLEYISLRTKISMQNIPGIVLVDEIDLHLHP